MSESEDKEAKMKEIRNRLDEIQKNSATPASQGNVSPDNSKKEETKVEVSQTEISKPVGPKAVKKSEETTTKGKKWQANKLVGEGEEEPTNKKEKKSGSSLSLVYTIFSLVVTLSIISYLTYTLLLDSDEVEVVETMSDTKAVDESATTGETGDEVTSVESQDEMSTEAVEVPVESPDQSAKQKFKVVDEGRVKESPPKAQMPASNSKSKQLIPNGIVISYSSNSNKDAAEKNVVLLSDKGFDAHYYFMPDKDADSPALYKVYIGPYKDESAAMPDFRKIVAINNQAFILRLN